MDPLIETIRAALHHDADALVRRAGLVACRKVIAAIEVDPDAPPTATATPPSSVVTVAELPTAANPAPVAEPSAVASVALVAEPSADVSPAPVAEPSPSSRLAMAMADAAKRLMASTSLPLPIEAPPAAALHALVPSHLPPTLVAGQMPLPASPLIHALAPLIPLIGNMPTEQLLELAIAKLRERVPAGSTAPAPAPVRYQVLPVRMEPRK